MDRRSFVGMLGGMLPLAAIAQHAASNRVKRLGVIVGSEPSLFAAFDASLRQLGWVPGENVIVELRKTRANTADSATYAAELARMNLDVVLVGSLPPAIEMRKAKPDQAMVIATCPGLVSNGFAATMDRPGGHSTGIDELPPGVTAKRMKLLKTAVPRLSRVALVSTTPGRGGHERQLADAAQIAPELGISVKPYRATNLDELKTALGAIADDRMEALATFQGAVAILNRQVIIDFAAAHRLPAMYQATAFVESGGLMAWAPDLVEQYRDAARYIDQVLKGASPGDLPARYPSGYFLTINAGTAKALDLVLPPALLAQADRVI